MNPEEALAEYEVARREQLEAERKYNTLDRAVKQASRDMRKALERRLRCEKKLRDLGVAIPSRNCHT